MSKRRRINDQTKDTRSYNSTNDLASLLSCSSTTPSAFSPTANLIAVAAAPSPSSTSDSLLLSDPTLSLPQTLRPLKINLTYLTGPTTSSLPRLNFQLQLPLTSLSPSSTTTRIKLLSFSPDGAYLLSVSGSTDAENDGIDDYLTVFEQNESGCIDQWEMILHEQAATFGKRSTGMTNVAAAAETDGKEVVSVRWVGEPRAWYPNPEYATGEDSSTGGQKPFSCAPPRSSPLAGAAFVAVLSSDEIVFVHLPRTSPLLPNIVCMPLHPPPSALSSPPSSSSSTLPVSELTVLSPSRRALTLTAVPTPPTSNSLSNSSLNPTLPILNGVVPLAIDQPTPTSHISQLVGSLVSTLPTLDSSLPLPIAPSPAAGAGNAALKEELRAAELANSIGGDGGNGISRRRRRIRYADVGATRGSREDMEEGITRFLIASATRRARSKPRRVVRKEEEEKKKQEVSIGSTAKQPVKEETNLMNDLGINMNLDEENFDLNAIDGFDFGSLDAAFGSSSEPSTSTGMKPNTTTPGAPDSPEKKANETEGEEEGVKEWEEWERENEESVEEEENRWRIEVSEVRIDMLNVDGPRLTVRPQPHFFASPPTFASNAEQEDVQDGTITHLAFLEDNHLSSNETSSSSGSESAVDLRLLVVSTSVSNSSPRSSLANYAFSNEPYALSEAFSHLECRKADLQTVDLGEWSTRFTHEAQLPDSAVVTALAPRATGRELGTFFAVIVAPNETSGEIAWKSKVAILSSEPLLPVDSQTETILPDSNLYSSIVLSPNAAVVVCLPHSASSWSPPRPVIAASPLAQDPATRIALSLIKQSDSADVTGVATSRKEEPQSLLDLLDSTHSLLQAQLPSNRPLFNTSIQFDLLGLATSLLAPSSSTDATINAKVNTARGLIDLAAAVRAFGKVEKKERGAAEATESYRCETDALCPLVGHASWYSEFVERLIRDLLRSPSDPPSPLLLHLLHPLARSLHKRLLTCLLGLSSTLATLAAAPEPGMSLAEQEMTDLASKVVQDAVSSGVDGGLEKWKSLIEKVTDVEGLDKGQPFGSSLSTLTIPQTFHPQCTTVLSLIRQAYPSLCASASDSLPSPPTTPSSSATSEWDLIRRCKLPPQQQTTSPTRVMMKQCLRCGQKSGAVNTTTLTAGVWAAFEESWRNRCACGGFWKTV
ncbi:uncharacterized protein JCM6883_006074 [Sporobolomyces salmoneus]|uniref:uncharacterized protein n=1 Tax=Sporobolomyces salmoneus TaxID=183962 RepID=UPI0031704C36